MNRTASSAAGSIRLVLVSRQQLFRECLGTRLESSSRLVVSGVAGSVEEAAKLCRARGAHLLVVDGVGLDEASYRLLAGISTGDGEPRTVILGLPDSVSDVRRCAEAGVSGFAYRDTPLDELTRTLEAVTRGEKVCGATVSRELCRRLSRLGRNDRRRERMKALRLTARQMEVLRWVARGLGNHEIADRLGLSPYTVKNHVHGILERLEVRDRTEAVAVAFRNRWLP